MQTSIWSLITKEPDEPIEENKHMTANVVQAGAVSHELADWHAIEWQKVNENVRRLQARIVKATQENRWVVEKQSGIVDNQHR